MLLHGITVEKCMENNAGGNAQRKRKAFLIKKMSSNMTECLPGRLAGLGGGGGVGRGRGVLFSLLFAHEGFEEQGNEREGKKS